MVTLLGRLFSESISKSISLSDRCKMKSVKTSHLWQAYKRGSDSPGSAFDGKRRGNTCLEIDPMEIFGTAGGRFSQPTRLAAG